MIPGPPPVACTGPHGVDALNHFAYPTGATIAKIPPELAKLRTTLLDRITQSDLHWHDVKLAGGYTIQVCSPVCMRATADELKPVVAYLAEPQPTGMWLYVPVSSAETRERAKRWDVFPMTRAVSDQVHNQAVVVSKPPWPPPKDSQTRLADFVGYSQKLRAQYFSYQGWAIVSGAHKVWVLSARGKNINHGFQDTLAVCKTIPTLKCTPGPNLDPSNRAIQNIGAAHDSQPQHWDYSQMMQYMHTLKDDQGKKVDLAQAIRDGHPSVWDEGVKIPEANML